tara:strand:+ start:333 stop:1160 length:828 start_codon:yes stop_codon:yes gene_type:complete
MPYTQKWGISRNAFQSPLNYDDPAKTSSREEDMPTIPKVDTDPNSDEDIIAANNKAAEIENAKSAPTIGGPEWEKKQKEVFEKDSGWTQLGTLLSNPFQGMSAFMQQMRGGAQGLIGNEYADAGTGSSLTSLRRSKDAQSRGANVHIPGEILNSATQWIPPAIAYSSAHSAITGTGQIATGNVGGGTKNIAKGIYAYIPGLNKIKGGNTVVNKSLKSVDKVTGSNFKNIGPKVQSFLSNTADKISKTNLGKKVWNFMDKGGTYGYKTNKIIEQSS